MGSLQVACASVAAGGRTGSAFLVAPEFALTCRHVVDHLPLGSPVRLRFAASEAMAVVEALHGTADCALLRVTSPPEGTRPLLPGVAVAGGRFTSLGFPDLVSNLPNAVVGEVRLPGATGPDGQPALQLFSPDAAAGPGGVMQGFSGAPVVVEGRVVGILYHVIPGPGGLALHGLLYACPISKGMELLPSSAITPPGLPFQAAGSGYQREWFVDRPKEVKRARLYLQGQTPVVLLGPSKMGKSWIFDHLLTLEAQEKNRSATILRVDFDALGGSGLRSASVEEILFLLGTEFSAVVPGFMDRLPPRWKDWKGGTAEFSRAFEEGILGAVSTPRVILALDHADSFWGTETGEKLFAMLRHWARGSSGSNWTKLRLVMAASTEPALWINANTSPLPVQPIPVGDFTANQATELARRYGIPASSQDIDEAMAWVGGHPLLLRLLMDAAVVEEQPLSSLVREPRVFEVLSDHLTQRWMAVEAEPDLRGAMREVLTLGASAKIASEAGQRLDRAGLFTVAYGRCEVRYRVYERHFRRLMGLP